MHAHLDAGSKGCIPSQTPIYTATHWELGVTVAQVAPARGVGLGLGLLGAGDGAVAGEAAQVASMIERWALPSQPAGRSAKISWSD